MIFLILEYLVEIFLTFFWRGLVKEEEKVGKEVVVRFYVILQGVLQD